MTITIIVSSVTISDISALENIGVDCILFIILHVK